MTDTFSSSVSPLDIKYILKYLTTLKYSVVHVCIVHIPQSLQDHTIIQTTPFNTELFSNCNN